jgi:hypothetical protein
MAIEIGTKQECRWCERKIIYRRPLDKDGAENPLFYKPYWFHDDDRPDWLPEDHNRWGAVKLRCKPQFGQKEDAVPSAMPKGICNYDLNTEDGGKCGRKIPEDNRREDIYACGIHAKHEREKQSLQMADRLRQEREVAEGDLRAWARQNIGAKVAKIIEHGLAVQWESGEREYSYGRDKDPSFFVKVNIDDLLEYINAHSG